MFIVIIVGSPIGLSTHSRFALCDRVRDQRTCGESTIINVNIDARGATKEAVVDLKAEVASGGIIKQITKALEEHAARRGIAVVPIGLTPKVAL